MKQSTTNSTMMRAVLDKENAKLKTQIQMIEVSYCASSRCVLESNAENWRSQEPEAAVRVSLGIASGGNN